MGNSTSNATRPTSIQPTPALRIKKKSLELPDLASLTYTNTRPPKSASIPIPPPPPPPSIIPGEAGRHRPPSYPSDLILSEHSTHIPFPPLRIRQAHIQDLYNQSHLPPPSPTSSIPKFIPETVLSSLPLALSNPDPASNNQHFSTSQQQQHLILVPCRISWNAGGKSVYLARAGDDDWKGRQLMEREYVYHHPFILFIHIHSLF